MQKSKIQSYETILIKLANELQKDKEASLQFHAQLLLKKFQEACHGLTARQAAPLRELLSQPKAV